MSIKRRAWLIGLLLAGATPAAAARDRVNVFLGRYGYALEYPAGYTALPGLEDSDPSMEKVLIFPKGTPADRLGEKDFAARRIVRLQVAPLNMRGPRGAYRAGLKEFLVAIPEALRRMGARCAVTKFRAPMPAAMFKISGGVSLVQVVLEGRKVVYVFTAAEDGPRLRAMIGSLREIAPTDDPGL